MAQNPPQTALVLFPDVVGRMALRVVLRQAGFPRVLEAESATEALTTLAAERVDLVLTAWEVEDGHGPALIRSLRDRGLNRNLPVVLLNNGLSQRNVVLAVKAGAAGKLTLPASARALSEVLLRHQEGRRRPVDPQALTAVRSPT